MPQATIVREGDKIYVGDFVLRVELTPSSPSSGPNRPSAVGSSTGASGSVETAPLPPPVSDKGPAARPSLTFEAEFTARHDLVGGSTLPESGEGSRRTGHDLSEHVESTSPRLPSPSLLPESPREGPPARSSQGIPVATLVPRPSSLEPPTPPPDCMATGRALALGALVERVAEGVDLSPLARGAEPDQVLSHRIERVIRDKVRVLRDEGHLAENIDIDDVSRDAQRELLGLGAIEPLIDDDEISEIRVFGHNHVTAVRNGDGSTSTRRSRAKPRFTASSCACADNRRSPWRREKPSSSATCSAAFWCRRFSLPRRTTGTPSCSASGAAPRLHSTTWFAAEPSRAPWRRSSALASCRASTSSSWGPPKEPPCCSRRWRRPANRAIARLLCRASTSCGAWSHRRFRIRLPDNAEEAVRLVRGAARLRPDRLVVHPMGGAVSAAVAGTITEGAEGVLATAAAPSLRHALDRLVADLMAARPGMTASAAQSWLLGSFELAVEVARLRDRRHRVLRIAELHPHETGIIGRDVFTFGVERTAAGGAIEGTFAATGLIPRLAEDLALRGSPLDHALFKRERG